MIGFGLRPYFATMMLSAFLFFACLPFLNAICDYYIRVEVVNDFQGRVFGLLTSLSQIGYALAYASAGLAADFVFEPLFIKNDQSLSLVKQIVGSGKGRGIGFYLVMLGIFLAFFSLMVGFRLDKKGGKKNDY